ncbi:MAG: hypothetical protein ABI411_14715 [Tahibacter sp.]
MLPQRAPQAVHHEVIKVFRDCGIALCTPLTDMLDENVLHRTERRGCGYTQATRLLAPLINQPMLPLILGAGVFQPGVEREFSGRDALLETVAERSPALLGRLSLPESRLLTAMILDVILRKAVGLDLGKSSEEKLPIGSCPLAEQFFLEIAYERIRRGGHVNIVVSDSGVPILIEKCELGDNHSSISVAPTVLNGVHLPAGSLIGIERDRAADDLLPSTRNGRGRLLPLHSLRRVRFLRLTTLAVAPEDRKRAFTTHFEQQIRGELFSPGTTRIEQLARFAADQAA